MTGKQKTQARKHAEMMTTIIRDGETSIAQKSKPYQDENTVKLPI